jgi:DNA-directed RNA polymerase sigma subunit (sigma70/sigma32)
LNEIGSGLGVTAERARQIEVGALQELRERFD